MWPVLVLVWKTENGKRVQVVGIAPLFVCLWEAVSFSFLRICRHCDPRVALHALLAYVYVSVFSSIKSVFLFFCLVAAVLCTVRLKGCVIVKHEQWMPQAHANNNPKIYTQG